jgi:hypothetical protein
MYVRGNQPDSFRFLEKDVPSGIDGVPSPYAPTAEAYDPYLQKVFQAWDYRKRHVFAIDGAPCGLEVCLDHGDGATHRVLKTVLSDWPKNEKTGWLMTGVAPPEVSLHLLTAGGMSIRPRSVAARENGYILRNDGYSTPPHSELRKVRRYTKPWSLLDAAPSDLAGTVEFSNEQFDPFVTLPLADKELVPMFGNGYYEFPQRLVVYPRCVLP